VHRAIVVEANKQIGFFSDAYCVEWTYAKTIMVRRQMARVLAEKIEQGQYTRNDALAIARAILYESPRTLLGMKARVVSAEPERAGGVAEQKTAVP